MFLHVFKPLLRDEHFKVIAGVTIVNDGKLTENYPTQPTLLWD